MTRAQGDTTAREPPPAGRGTRCRDGGEAVRRLSATATAGRQQPGQAAATA